MIAETIEIEYALYSLEAEMSTLGCMLLSERAARETSAMLKEDDFYRPAHKLIFKAMKSLVDAKKPIDMLLLPEELKNTGALGDIGGEDYLLEIATYVPSASNSAYYAGVVIEKSRRRGWGKAVNEIKRLIHSGSLEEINKAAESAAKGLSYSPNRFVKIWQVECSKPEAGINTGFSLINGQIGTRGFPIGQMSVVFADKKAGKSSFMLSSLVSVCSQQFKVAFVTVADLNAQRLKARIMRNLCGFTSMESAKAHGLLAEFKAAEVKLEADFDLEFYDATKSGEDIETILAAIESRSEKEPFEIVYLDYAQKLWTRDAKVSDATATGDICSAKISTFCERTGIPFVVASQKTPSNPREGRSRSMTKGSNKWLEDCGWALDLTRGEGQSAEIEIAYSRFGPMYGKVPMIFNAERLRFEEVVGV